MKLSHCLLRQHIGFHFKNHWRVQGKRKPIDTGAEKILTQKGVQLYTPEDILKENRVYERIEIVGYKPKPIKFDETHPNWHSRTLLSYKDENVLVEGLNQAKIITNTVELQNGLPESITLKDIPKAHNRRIKNIILGTHVYDAEQKKIEKVKDPKRPAFNFPRIYGITNPRIYKLLMSRLLNFIETTSSENLVKERLLLNDLLFSYPFEKSDNLIQFQLRGDALLTSSRLLQPITNERTDSIDLPDIYPVKYTITLKEENIYELENIYPIKPSMSKVHPHTLFIHYNKDEVKNLYEEEVTDDQIFGRSLLKTFTAAASYARQKFGDGTKLLPNPVTVQCVQTDGRLFHFGILQLNTLDLEDPRVKNIWYQTEWIPLFEKCCYSLGKPILEGYNKEAVKYLISLYNRT